MRRFQALLIAAGLAASPLSAAAGPSIEKDATPQYEKFESFAWSTSKGRLGVMVMGLTPELRKHMGAADDRGVLVARVDTGTPAAAAGIRVGDVIVDVQGRTIEDAGDVLAALANIDKGDQVNVQLIRDKKPLTVKATLSSDAQSLMTNPDWPTRWFRDLMKPFSELRPNSSSNRT